LIRHRLAKAMPDPDSKRLKPSGRPDAAPSPLGELSSRGPAPGDPDESAKAACRAEAQHLATARGAQDARAMQRAGTLRLPPPTLAIPASAASESSSTSAGGDEKRRGPWKGGAAARPISIWEPRGEGADLAFVRPAPLPLGDHFASRREIRPKRAHLPLRVCLFGESAAAGYLYAPHFTPAMVLEAQLRAVAGDGAAEVIDLARTNETLPSLAATLESAVQIQPDVILIFAGNNWNLLETPEVSPYAPAVSARQRYAEAWREAGPAGPVALAAKRLRAVAAATFEHVALIARAIGVPVVLIVPEVSLDGWESRQPLRWLPAPGRPHRRLRSLDPPVASILVPAPRASGGPGAAGRAREPHAPPAPISAWYRLLARARRCLSRGAWTAAAEAARAMLEIDGGDNPTTWRLLARACQGKPGHGDEAAAAQAARAEVDAAAYPTLAFLGAPQATTLAQDLLRQAARRHGFACVDLPRIFAAHTGSPLPGRRLFLDYCHLTAEGIEVAMAAAAAEVLRLSGIASADGDLARQAPGEPGAGAASSRSTTRGALATSHGAAGAPTAADLGWQELLRRLPPQRPTPQVEALARFGAAVHGAHRLLAVGPKAPFLEAWCGAALEASPGIESAMLDLLAARAAPIPALLTPAQGRNLASSHPLGLAHGWQWDHADSDLAAAILASLERHHGAPPRDAQHAAGAEGAGSAAAEVEAQMIAHHGLRPGGIDLIDPPYSLWEPLERFFPEVMTLDDQPRPALLRAPWPETSFCLVCDALGGAGLEITARLALPPSTTPGEPYRGLAGRGSRRRRGTLRISVNGRLAASVPLRENWTRPTAILPRHLLRRGSNRLTLHWPMPPAGSGDAALAAALSRLDEGIAADLHPVFGEVWSLRAHPL
jgi:hypothetical protein